MVQPQSMSITVKVMDCLAVSGVCVNVVVHFRNACRVSVMDASDTLSRMIQPWTVTADHSELSVKRGARCDSHEHHAAARTNALERSAGKRSCMQRKAKVVHEHSIDPRPLHEKRPRSKEVMGMTRHASVRLCEGRRRCMEVVMVLARHDMPLYVFEMRLCSRRSLAEFSSEPTLDRRISGVCSLRWVVDMSSLPLRGQTLILHGRGRPA
jgi:hypothetical protein